MTQLRRQELQLEAKEAERRRGGAAFGAWMKRLEETFGARNDEEMMEK